MSKRNRDEQRESVYIYASADTNANARFVTVRKAKQSRANPVTVKGKEQTRNSYRKCSILEENGTNQSPAT
jgi:hypothetical protein